MFHNSLKITFCSVLVFAGCALSKEELEERFLKVETGQAKNEVIKLLGDPTEVEYCRPVPGETPCAENLRYIRFMETWGVLVDGEGKVTGKYLQVSP